MPNLQLIEKPVDVHLTGTTGMLDVVDIFYTIQGEGPYAGRPAVFVRLAGCNLNCPSCDTDYTTGRTMMTIEEILKKILELWSATKQMKVGKYESSAGVGGLVVITGGEPFRQQIQPLCFALLSRTWFTIQVESNGTLFQNWNRSPGVPELQKDFVWNSPRVTVVVSPKTGEITTAIQRFCRHLKYVVSADNIDHIDGLPHTTLGRSNRVARPWPEFAGTIYVQPLDECDLDKNRANTEAAVRSCMKHGYTLCLQLHKTLNLP